MAESVSASLDADDQEVLGEAPSVAPSNGVGEKLALLDDLHKQGLISDEEYASRRQAILDAALE
jgi:hypothetical protein